MAATDTTTSQILLIADTDGVEPQRIEITGLPSEILAGLPPEDRGAVLGQMLEIGAAALLHGTSTSLLASFDAQIERHVAGMEGHSSEFIAGLSAMGEALKTNLDAHLQRALADFSERSGRTVGDLNAAAQSLVTAKSAQARMSNPRGLDYEAAVAPHLDAFFAPAGDIVESVGGSVGALPRNKKGDWLISLDAGQGRTRRIVFEAKDRPGSRLTGPDGVIAYIDEAMENREAQVGVLVCASMPPELRDVGLRLIGMNRLIVHFDPETGDPMLLRFAAQIARALAMAHREDDDSAVDLLAVQQCVERLRDILDAAREIKRGGQEAARGAERVLTSFERLMSSADSEITALSQALAAPDPEA